MYGLSGTDQSWVGSCRRTTKTYPGETWGVGSYPLSSLTRTRELVRLKVDLRSKNQSGVSVLDRVTTRLGTSVSECFRLTRVKRIEVKAMSVKP